MSDHASQAVDNCRQRNGARGITVAVHFRSGAREVEHGRSLNAAHAVSQHLPRGVVVSGVRRTNEVNARRARLVPGWATVFGRVYHLGM